MIITYAYDDEDCVRDFACGAPEMLVGKVTDPVPKRKVVYDREQSRQTDEGFMNMLMNMGLAKKRYKCEEGQR